MTISLRILNLSNLSPPAMAIKKQLGSTVITKKVDFRETVLEKPRFTLNSLNLICAHCGKLFEGENTKFCSQGCRDSHIVAIDKKTREVVNDNQSHTSRMSKD